jgi:hypothetical protein
MPHRALLLPLPPLLLLLLLLAPRRAPVAPPPPPRREPAAPVARRWRSSPRRRCDFGMMWRPHGDALSQLAVNRSMTPSRTTATHNCNTMIS